MRKQNKEMRDSLIYSAMWVQPRVSTGVAWALVYRDICHVGETNRISTELQSPEAKIAPFMIFICLKKLLDESHEENLQQLLKERT